MSEEHTHETSTGVRIGKSVIMTDLPHIKSTDDITPNIQSLLEIVCGQETQIQIMKDSKEYSLISICDADGGNRFNFRLQFNRISVSDANDEVVALFDREPNADVDWTRVFSALNEKLN